MRKIILCLLIVMMLMSAGMTACAQTQERVFDPAVSVTTGLPTDKPYRPITVNLDNEMGARPIYGIADADVVYELPLYKGGYTRYTAVFNDTLPEFVEGVRSARIVHVDLYREWGGALAYAGVQEYKDTNVYDYMEHIDVYVNMDAMHGAASRLFTRDEERSSPHNLRFALREAVEGELYDVEAVPHAPLYFDAENPTLGKERVREFAIRYHSGYLPSYIYEEEKNAYTRYYNWEPMLDAQGRAVTCENVIIMHVRLKWLNDRDDQPKYNLLYGGQCEYFIGGTYFTGTFEKERISKNTRYYDEAGNLVRFLPGKTFIQLVDEETGIEIMG